MSEENNEPKGPRSIRELEARELEGQPPALPVDDTLKLPPQIKYGLAIIQRDDDTVMMLPINPHGLHVTLGMVMRLIGTQYEEVKAEMLARKLAAFLQQPAPGDDGLVDLG